MHRDNSHNGTPVYERLKNNLFFKDIRFSLMDFFVKIITKENIHCKNWLPEKEMKTFIRRKSGQIKV